MTSTNRATLRGDVELPGDKSITHRAILFGAIAEGDTLFRTTSLGRDNLSSLRIVRQLGVEVSGTFNRTIYPIAKEEGLGDFSQSDADECVCTIRGKGFAGLRAPTEELYCGNSGTTARLLTGLLAGLPFRTRLTGDASLSRRPFRRVTEPLSQMGASFSGESMPLEVYGVQAGTTLRGISYRSPHASAQVKSAILLAGLQSEQPVEVWEPRLSRDHTERMFTAMGCPVRSVHHADGGISVSLPAGKRTLRGISLTVPADFSAAAFFLVAGTIFPGAHIRVKNVCVNPTRTGLLDVLRRMGADISVADERESGGEEVVDFIVRASRLRGAVIQREEVVRAIDEIPILAVAAALAEGETVIRGAEELRVKESDRIKMSAAILQTFGVEVEELPDGLVIMGRPSLGASAPSGTSPGGNEEWRRSGDHRIAMSGAILELLTRGSFVVDDSHAVETSFPGFGTCLSALLSKEG